jgi:hypothetical protein
MRYIDSGSRNVDHALGSWLLDALSESIVEVRIQSGFFAAEGLGILVPTLQNLASHNGLVRILIGSNRPGTFRDDVLRLAELLGLPRTNAGLGVVCYSNAFFHPKVYHLRRSDNSQCAYVGSANLTTQGLTSLHVEAGVLLDTRESDPVDVLDNIATAIDEWFAIRREGFYLIVDFDAVDHLVDQGILATAPPPPPPSTGRGGGGQGGSAISTLRPLITLPPIPGPPSPAPTPPPTPTPLGIRNPSVVRDHFPGYLLFSPDATSPTNGSEALSGATLPAGADGLIIRLNNDSARHFEDRPGTANISVPVATLATLRFGVYGHGAYPGRPRAQYTLLLRYLGQNTTINYPHPLETNVMAYGFMRGESGHGDVRMLVPTGVRQLRTTIQQQGLPVPEPGDLALLEWPTMNSPTFRITFIQRGSDLYEQVSTLFDNAVTSHQLVGGGACWLPPGLSPDWQE